MLNSKKNGSTDRPIETFEKDEFAIEAYIEVLSEFIEECETPMTIAVQGDWGCGKTSMMNMVRQYLKKSETVLDIWFNTWQFSQFNMDDKLVVTFLQYLIKSLAERLPEGSEEKKSISSKFGPILKTITIGMTKHFVGSDIGDMVEGVIDETSKKEKKSSGLAEDIFELKKSFQELIQKIVGTTNKRVVVFIDDLDRLQPVRAVELLEVLKLFLDCDDCVFVMAIDTSVVFQGIREKYGMDMSNEKAQSFFDKMIQLPFKMPTAYYQLDKMLVRLLDFLNDETMNEEERKKYIAIIREVTGGNPRTIKRLSNAVLLMDKVAIRRNLYRDEDEEVQSLIRKILVVLACVQLRYEPTYGFLVNNINYAHMNGILELKKKIPEMSDADRGKILITELCKLGMPDEPINEELVFFNLMYLFIELSREFVCMFQKGSNNVPAIKKLLQVVSLNNIRDEITVNPDRSRDNSLGKADTVCVNESGKASGYEETEITENGSSRELYFEMLLNGQTKEVYDLFIAENIYPCIENMKIPYSRDVPEIGSHSQEMKDMMEKRIEPKEFELFSEMDGVFRNKYQVVEKEKSCWRWFDYSLRYDEDKLFSLVFEPENRSVQVWLPTKYRLTPDMEAFAWYERMIEEEMDEYQRLQKEYGEYFFPSNSVNQDIEIERDENGAVQSIEGRFFVVSKTMAELLIAFFARVASNPDALKRNISDRAIKKEKWDNDKDLLSIIAKI